MNFTDLCLQVAQESTSEFNQTDVKKVLLSSIRVMLEEFSINPIDAELNIKGFGKFCLGRHKYHVGNCVQGNDSEYRFKWVIRFCPSRILKELINGVYNPIDYQVSGNYLYPEYHMENGVLINSQGKKSAIQPKQIRYRYECPRDLHERKVKLLEDGTYVERRGRPRSKRSVLQVRHIVLLQMRRDLRRELRWERQGKITKDDWTIARW